MQATVVALVCAWLLPASSAYAKILHEERSLYSRIIVKQTGSTLCLQFNVRSDQRNQSCIDKRKPRAMVFSYTRMSMTSLLFSTAPQNILVIGLGGGTLPTAFAELFPQANVDAVEIDPAVVDVAREFFGFVSSERLQVHTQDARVWTKRAVRKPRRYDIIVLDAFNGEYIPEHLMTREYLQETKALLAPGGTLVANTFSISNLYDHESATYAEVFGDFINFRIPESSNRVVVVPGAEVSDVQLKERADELAARFKPYDIPIKRYTRILIKNRGAKPDWRNDARVLTDQFAPANLLQGR
jgi:spermidine synthase